MKHKNNNIWLWHFVNLLENLILTATYLVVCQTRRANRGTVLRNSLRPLRFDIWLTSRSRVQLETPMITPPIKNFPIFYGTREFIVLLTKSRNVFLSWAIWIHYTMSLPFLRSILTSSSPLRQFFSSTLSLWVCLAQQHILTSLLPILNFPC
jgi:hypothetical protein